MNPHDMTEAQEPVNKVQAIRQFLAEHPDASPRAVTEAMVALGFQVSPALVSAVKARLESAKQSGDSVNDLLVTLGKAQVDAMFRRQDDYPVDDSEFLPLVEAALNAFEMAGIDEDVVEAVWEHAFQVYDQMCKETVPESTMAENKRLMQSYLLGKRRKNRKR
ncbi:MAG: hypothetical protein NTY19_14700 [Planctomycetota bacterium]|nr:hypothetical protein [Planctomycetota bacterium]